NLSGAKTLPAGGRRPSTSPDRRAPDKRGTDALAGTRSVPPPIRPAIPELRLYKDCCRGHDGGLATHDIGRGRMGYRDFLNPRWLGVRSAPQSEEQSFLGRAQVQQDDEIIVRGAVLDRHESERFFGVNLARRGIQPVWLEITNHGKQPYRLRLASLDPTYYPPLEAAYANHFHIGRRLLGFGLLAWFFLPLVILPPFKVLGARMANRRMNAYFQQH